MKQSEYLHPDITNKESLFLVKQALSTPRFQQQLPNPLFRKEELQKLPQHKWMEKVNMTLVTKDKFPSLIHDLLPHLEKNSVHVPRLALAIPDMENPPLMMGLDTETTGLSKTIEIHGGNPTIPELIVGICIATSITDGYYIPLLHNQTDKVENYSYQEGLDFLLALQDDKYVMVYHNSQYDREILETNGVDLNPEYLDSMLMLLNMNYKSEYFTVGLKQMAEKILHRPMLEIKELSNSKEYIPPQYFPATTFNTYGCSDAVNTYALALHALDEKHPKNPYKMNKFPMRLDMKACDYTRWMLRPGLPVDYEYLKKNIRTLFRRKIILIAKFKKEVTDKVDIGSPEQVGIFLGSMIYERYKAHVKSHDESLTDDQIFKKYQSLALELFYCEVKVKELKSGGKKITYSSGDDILTSYRKIHEKNISWIPDNEKNILKTAAELIGIYRSVVHDIGVFASMYRFAYVDDLNYHRASVGLKFNGTITNRYSNQDGSGSKDRFTIRRLVRSTSVSYYEASATCGLNLQGVNSSRLKMGKAKKIVKAPPEFYQEKEKLDNQVEVNLRAYLEEL